MFRLAHIISIRRFSFGIAVVWLVSCYLLIRINSQWVFLATTGFVSSLAGLAVRGQRKADSLPVPRSVISAPPEIPSIMPLGWLAGAAALINAAFLAEGMRHFVASGLLAAIATAMILLRFSSMQKLAIAEQRRMSGFIAVALTVLSLLDFGGGGLLGGGLGWPSQLSGNRDRPADAPSFRDVLVFIDKPLEHLISPPPGSPEKSWGGESSEPMVIPFSGVYWIFKGTDWLQSAESVIRHGSPDNLFFRSTDYLPLKMEAHQSLGRHIQFDCCSDLELDLINADKYPGTVLIEVTLSDNISAARQKIRLGFQPVRSTQFRYNESAPKQETLHYSIPAGHKGGFNEITVRFHLGGIRPTQSARVAIQRFRLKPRIG